MNEPYEQSETGCCPRFDPEPWDEKEMTLQNRFFVKDKVRTFFHIPLNFGRVMVKNMEMIKSADALAPEPLMLCDEKSFWTTDIYIAVSKAVPKMEMTKIFGTFLTKVFEGPYRYTGRWIKEMKAYAESKGKETKKIYTFYTTCPGCAKVYGKNYTVILAMV